LPLTFCVNAEAATLLAAADDRGLDRIFDALDATFADVDSLFLVIPISMPGGSVVGSPRR